MKIEIKPFYPIRTGILFAFYPHEAEFMIGIFRLFLLFMKAKTSQLVFVREHRTIGFMFQGQNQEYFSTWLWTPTPIISTEARGQLE